MTACIFVKRTNVVYEEMNVFIRNAGELEYPLFWLSDSVHFPETPPYYIPTCNLANDSLIAYPSSQYFETLTFCRMLRRATTGSAGAFDFLAEAPVLRPRVLDSVFTTGGDTSAMREARLRASIRSLFL